VTARKTAKKKARTKTRRPAKKKTAKKKARTKTRRPAKKKTAKKKARARRGGERNIGRGRAAAKRKLKKKRKTSKPTPKTARRTAPVKKPVAPDGPRATGGSEQLPLRPADPAAQADAVIMRDKVLPKLSGGAPLTRHEAAVYKRYEKAKAARYRDEGMRAFPQKDLEGLLQTPRKVLLEWEAAGLPRNADKGRTYDLWQVLPWLKKRWLEQAKASPASPEAANARERKIIAEARKREIEVEVLEKSLVSREEAASDRVAIVQAFAAILDRLPTDFRSAFASVNVARQAEWLDSWQTGERARLIAQGGVPATDTASGAKEAKQ